VAHMQARTLFLLSWHTHNHQPHFADRLTLFSYSAGTLTFINHILLTQERMRRLRELEGQ